MSLKVTGLSYAHPAEPNCKHVIIDYEDDTVAKSFAAGHETQVLQNLKRIALENGFRDREEEFLLEVWLALMLEIRGATKANCYNFELEPTA